MTIPSLRHIQQYLSDSYSVVDGVSTAVYRRRALNEWK